MSAPPWVDAAALPMAAAIEAIERALLGGLDPAADDPRSVVAWPPAGQLLLMPSFDGHYAGVKLATVAPQTVPRIKGVFVLFDGGT